MQSTEIKIRNNNTILLKVLICIVSIGIWVMLISLIPQENKNEIKTKIPKKQTTIKEIKTRTSNTKTSNKTTSLMQTATPKEIQKEELPSFAIIIPSRFYKEKTESINLRSKIEAKAEKDFYESWIPLYLLKKEDNKTKNN